VDQARFEFLVPAVLGEPPRQAMHRRETPGVDFVRGIKQLARPAGIMDRLPLRRRTGWAQATGNRVGGRAPSRSAAIT
jgi:hypothetical protein